MNITKKRLRQIIKEECGAVMADSQGIDDSHSHPPAGDNMTITGSPDHEIRMAYKQLNKAAKYSQSLASRMENMPEANLPSWVQAKITKASDYISMVYHYLEEELDADHDADAIVSLEKQPINEGIITTGLGIAALYLLYKALFGKPADPEMQLAAVRAAIEKKVAEVDSEDEMGMGSGRGPSDPFATEKQRATKTRPERMRAMAALDKMKAHRGSS